MSTALEVEALEMRLLFEAIHQRYGYDLRQYTSSSMERRIRALLVRFGVPNLGELQHRVLADARFFSTVLEHLTVQVSELFRHPETYALFRKAVVPALRSYPLLKIWHAGCASGEEAYASAILLSEEGLYDRAQIYATDLSTKVLEQAKQGVYPISRLEKFEQNYALGGGTSSLQSYYTAAYDHIAMKESLRRNVLFFQHNLAVDHVFGEMHVIFCRNVFIYFEAELREQTLKKFAQSLCPGGFLCLGDAERLPERYLRRTFEEVAPHQSLYRYLAPSRGEDG